MTLDRLETERYKDLRKRQLTRGLTAEQERELESLKVKALEPQVKILKQWRVK